MGSQNVQGNKETSELKKKKCGKWTTGKKECLAQEDRRALNRQPWVLCQTLLCSAQATAATQTPQGSLRLMEPAHLPQPLP